MKASDFVGFNFDIKKLALHSDEVRGGCHVDHPKGSFIYNRDGTDKGTVTGTYTPCQMEGCRGRRVWVRWPDGKLTKPCSRGLEFDKGLNAWKIG